MADRRLNHAREAFISACLTVSLGYGHRDVIRIVFEDVVPILRGHLSGFEDRLCDLAIKWLEASDQRHGIENDIGVICQQIFLRRAVNAHDRHRTAGA